MSNVALRSLVIDARNLDRLGLDGPALKVVMRGKSPILFPLRRLCRVHLIGMPNQGMEALMHCAEQNIPVAFFRLNGQIRCTLQKPQLERAQLDHWFEHVEFDPEVQQLYNDWRQHQALHALAQLGFNRGDGAVRQQLVYEALRGVCRSRLGKDMFGTALEWLDGLMTFHLLQVVEQFGFTHPRAKQLLLQDIKPIADLGLLYAFTRHVQASATFRVTPRSMTVFYQDNAQVLEYGFRRMLSQLTMRLEAVI